MTIESNPCLACGACCGYFRVSFYWGETDAQHSFGVPEELTEQVSSHLIAMRGTEKKLKDKQVKCVALQGQIGESVHCEIYQCRSSTCRDFKASWEDGLHNTDCDKARAAYGLKPLEPWNLMELGSSHIMDYLILHS